MPAAPPPRSSSSSPAPAPPLSTLAAAANTDPLRHALYDNQHSRPYPPWRPGHLTHPLLIRPANPYPHQLQPPPPPPVPHKVWILDCRSCGTFLTNRGMKAVLLLRPNVPLFSSDALPVNCSAYTSNPDVLRPPNAQCRPAFPPRTCECLTQTLCCHGCGAAVGYMIVIPCARCTSTTSPTNRATNGHRFVFHSSEITGVERRYVPGEPGVIPVEQPPVTLSFPPPPPPHPPAPPHHTPREDVYVPHSFHYNPHAQNVHSHRGPLPNTIRSDLLPTPPMDASELSPASSTSPSPVTGAFPFSSVQTEAMPVPLPISLSSDSGPPVRNAPSPAPSDGSDSSLRLASDPDEADSDEDDEDEMERDSPPPLVPSHWFLEMSAERLSPPPRTLEAGEVLFWHQLTRHGEIPGVCDDPRARKAPKPVKRILCGR